MKKIICPFCGREHVGRNITFNFTMMDPYFYSLYQRQPRLLLDRLTLCEECENFERNWEKKEW